VFVLGGTRATVPRWPLEDFFDGLETADLGAVGAAASRVRSPTAIV
jgi:hypothetical protein